MFRTFSGSKRGACWVLHVVFRTFWALRGVFWSSPLRVFKFGRFWMVLVGFGGFCTVWPVLDSFGELCRVNKVCVWDPTF